MTAASFSLEQRRARLQLRTVWVLSAATVLGGIGVGASLAVGALLLAEVSGNDAISGLASTMFNAGAAAAGIPLARIAARRGRRAALVTGSFVSMVGALVAILGAMMGQWVVLAVGIALVGVASAVQLMSRFAATDLALPANRVRDLSLVVWSITVGAVVGPNLTAPGVAVGEWLGILPLAGVFVFPFLAQILAVLVNWFGLRPDPLLLARELGATTPQPGAAASPLADDAPASESPQLRRAQVLVMLTVAMAQAVMVALMAMTPLHLMHHGGSPEIVGVTLSLHIAGMYAFAPVFGFLASRWGRVPVIVLGWAMLLFASAISYLSGPSHLLVQVALTLLGVGWSAVTVAGGALLTEITPAPERPKWQGRSDTLMSASGALAGALSGVVFAIGDFALLALVSGVLVAVGAAMLLPARTRFR